ncbi:MAG: hypothetical protein IPN85_07735 [Flavobacteriales bacterium]|jgi:hypothetical protein|nr:hypothetical protein [Flavobacteriales bacterium]
MALMGYYKANTIHYEGLMKADGEMNLVLVLLANLVFGTLVAWAAKRMGITTLQAGLVAGAIIGCLVYLSIDLMLMVMMNWYANHTIVIVDVLANTVWAAGMGAVAGFVLGTGKKSA